MQKLLNKKLLSIVSSLLLVVGVYYVVGAGEVVSKLGHLPGPTVLLLLLLYVVSQGMSALKWQWILSALKLHREFSKVVGAYFIGMFVNIAGLGTVGGDGIRAIAVAPLKGEKARAFGSVLLDRLHGLAVLSIIGAVGIVCNPPSILGEVGRTLAVLFLVGVLLAVSVLPRILDFLQQQEYFGTSLQNGVLNLRSVSWRVLVAVSCLSFLFHTLQIAMHYIMGEAIGLNVPFSYWLAIVPLVNIASSLPISFNGLGVREILCILLLTPLGVSEQSAVALSALWLAIVVVVGILGGVAVRVGSKKDVGVSHLKTSKELCCE